MLRKQVKISRSVFLTFTIYFVSEQGNRFGAKVISLGYLGYLNTSILIGWKNLADKKNKLSKKKKKLICKFY
jgi:hypothetical protein